MWEATRGIEAAQVRWLSHVGGLRWTTHPGNSVKGCGSGCEDLFDEAWLQEGLLQMVLRVLYSIEDYYRAIDQPHECWSVVMNSLQAL